MLVALVLLAAPLAACGKGGGSDNDGVASVSGSGASDDGGSSDDDSGGGGGGDRPSDQEMQDAALEYAQCMREHGIDMPDPQFDSDGNGGGLVQQRGPENPDEEEMQAADEACHHIMDDVEPEGGPIDPERQAEMQDQLTEVAKCMREKGYDMPDPQVDDNGRVTMQAGPGDGGGGPPDEGEDDEFQQDMEDCQEQAGMEPPGQGDAGDEGDAEDRGDA